MLPEGLITAEPGPNPETIISGYRVLGGLGRGNTSRVYLAEKLPPPPGVTEPHGPPVRTRVALKLPLASTLDNQAAAERFANEVRLTLQFTHPHLVGGLAGMPFGKGAFLALRHYPGGTLDRQLSGGPLSLEDALRLLADLASGLSHLHSVGAVHQDVKPQNIYLQGAPGAVKSAPSDFGAALGDFGSAYFQAQGGQVSGSPFYMPPESYRSELAGPPGDVYSFGVLAYELLSGTRPHVGDTYERLMGSHLTHFPPPLSVPGLSSRVARLLSSAIAKRPADRPASSELRATLRRALGQNDEQPEAGKEDAAPPAVNNGAPVGRHPVSTPTAGKVAPSAPASTPAPVGWRGWNPLRRKP